MSAFGSIGLMSAIWYLLAFAVAWGAAGWRQVAPWKVAAAFVVVVVLAGAAGVLRIYVPSTVEEGEIYLPYLFADGPVLWIASGMLSMCLERALPHWMETSAMFWIAIVPGAFHVLLGSAQWYGLACLARWAGAVGK